MRKRGKRELNRGENRRSEKDKRVNVYLLLDPGGVTLPGWLEHLETSPRVGRLEDPPDIGPQGIDHQQELIILGWQHPAQRG